MHCARCGLLLADPDARIEVLGLHEHEVENPHGHRYRVACFSRVTNVEPSTNPSSEWSWFPGYRWEAQVCRGCNELVGWRFTREGEQAFYSLIAAPVKSGGGT